MATFGLFMTPAQFSIQPAEFARYAEDNGFDTIWVGEHTHEPLAAVAPTPGGEPPPVRHRHFYDPFVTLATAAAVTTKLKLGTSIVLVPQHHPIVLAKSVATLDRVSNGRVLFGIGAGWRVEEMNDFQVPFAERWKLTRERVMAMREIWGNDVAEFHGVYNNFDAMYCWPKPMRPQGPPVLMGAWSKFVPARIADYCDGWIATDTIPLEQINAYMDEIRREMDKAGRSMDDLDLSMMLRMPPGTPDAHERIAAARKAGFTRCILHTDSMTPDQQWPCFEFYAKLAKEAS